jgi:hypothetical protein
MICTGDSQPLKEIPRHDEDTAVFSRRGLHELTSTKLQSLYSKTSTCFVRRWRNLHFPALTSVVMGLMSVVSVLDPKYCRLR